MNAITVLGTLLTLFCVGSISAEQQLASLELKLDRTVFLVNEVITATVEIK